MVQHTPPSAGELRAFATQLLSWADRVAVRPAGKAEAWQDMDGEELLFELARRLLETNRLRRVAFPDVPLGEPLWDVLLALFVHEPAGYRITLDRLARETGLEVDAVRRSLDKLAAVGLVESNAGRLDPWAFGLSLSLVGKHKMTDLLQDSAHLFAPHSDASLTA